MNIPILMAYEMYAIASHTRIILPLPEADEPIATPAPHQSNSREYHLKNKSAPIDTKLEAQGWKETNGTKNIFFMSKEEIKNISKDRTVPYAHMVVNYYQPQKAGPRVCITAGGNLINYLFKLANCTVDLTTAKILWNSVSSAHQMQNTPVPML
jgi:hypothetical protein